jgi:hypothetical protein
VPLVVTKVNIDTDGRLVWMRVHREHFRDHTDNYDFRKPGEAFIQAYADFVAHKAEKLLSAGRLFAVHAALRHQAQFSEARTGEVRGFGRAPEVIELRQAANAGC